MKKIFLVSGGLDSFLAWELHAEKKDVALFVDYGQKYAKKEYAAVKVLYPVFEYLKINKSIIEKNTYIANRNLLLAIIAVSYFDADEVVIAGLKDDNCADKNTIAFNDMSIILTNFSQKRIKITSPFFNLTKGQIIEQYVERGFDKKKLLQTISCYSKENGRCGNCPACVRWFVALESNNIKTGLQISNKMQNLYLFKADKYDIDRKNRLIKTLKYEI